MSRSLASLMRNYFPKRPSGATLHTLSKLYDVSVGFVPPILRLCIVVSAIAEGWLLLDIGWFVLFFYSECDMTFKNLLEQGHVKDIVIEEVLSSIREPYQTIWSSSLTNAQWHSVTWPNIMITSPPIRLYTDTWPLFYRTAIVYWLLRGFHRIFATGVACRQRNAYSSGHMVPFHLGLAHVLLVKTISPRKCRYFVGIFYSNIPRYFLDFTFRWFRTINLHIKYY